MQMAASSYTVDPTAPHTHTVIFLHGRGSNASEFCSEIFESQDSSGLYFTQLFPSVKWVFPCAKRTWSNLDQEELHQWFDMTSVQNAHADSEVQRPGLENSRTQLLGIIEEEEECVSEDRIVVAGISQGCAVALYTLLSMDVCVGGFFGLCGWLPLADELTEDRNSLRRWQNISNMPVLLQHCEDDGVVPIANGKEMRAYLEEMGKDVQWQQFEEGGHWVNEPEGVDGIVKFLRDFMAI
jgi:lysophospholipase-2